MTHELMRFSQRDVNMDGKVSSYGVGRHFPPRPPLPNAGRPSVPPPAPSYLGHRVPVGNLLRPRSSELVGSSALQPQRCAREAVNGASEMGLEVLSGCSRQEEPTSTIFSSGGILRRRAFSQSPPCKGPADVLTYISDASLGRNISSSLTRQPRGWSTGLARSPSPLAPLSERSSADALHSTTKSEGSKSEGSSGAKKAAVRRCRSRDSASIVSEPDKKQSLSSKLSTEINFTSMPSRWAVCLASSGAPRKKVPKRNIRLLKSVFSGRPPVLFFDYEPTCGAPQRDPSRVCTDDELQAQGFASLPKMYFCHVETADCHEYKAVVNTLEHGGLYRTDASTGRWCIYWGDFPKADLIRSFNPFQKANHFRASSSLGRKDLLWKNVYRMKRKFPDHFNITPESFVLPEDFHSWARSREQCPNSFWIYKPVGEACGRGIRLYSSKLASTDEHKLQHKSGIVQRYLDKPLLINGFKFDLRVYVVVTSFDPLKIYLNPEGLVRLATEPYSLSHENLDHQTMHLTNFSVNKHSAAYVQNLDGQIHEDASELQCSEPTAEAGNSNKVGNKEQGSDEECSGGSIEDSRVQASKWSFKQLREYFEKHGKDYDATMERTKDLIIKTLIAVEDPIITACQQGANFSSFGSAQRVGPNQTNFEIYGFDVMVDENLKPWLLEVNVFPSFASSSPLDKRIKTQLVADAFTLIGFIPFDYELVGRTLKEDAMRRLQGIAPKAVTISRSHTVQSIPSITSLHELGEGEWQTILDSHDELMRRGNLERIFPRMESLGLYADFFANPRYSNLVLDSWLKLGGERCFLPENQNQIPTWLPKQVCYEVC